MNITIVIPAYNEEKRIAATLHEYINFFHTISERVEFLVVLNGCIDNTKEIVKTFIDANNPVRMIEIKAAGKGLALRAGFQEALKGDSELIGFVDADMATRPKYFHELIRYALLPNNSSGNNYQYDGVIASRYMRGATVIPERPFIKRWGSKIFYESLAFILFGLYYADLQCGAKLFHRAVINSIVDQLTVAQFAFDVELLYLCKKGGFKIKEVPTIWYDQEGSKLTIFSGGFAMLGALIKLRIQHSWLGK